MNNDNDNNRCPDEISLCDEDFDITGELCKECRRQVWDETLDVVLNVASDNPALNMQDIVTTTKGILDKKNAR